MHIKRKENGIWTGSASLPPERPGQRNRKWGNGKQKRDVVEKLRAVVAEYIDWFVENVLPNEALRADLLGGEEPAVWLSPYIRRLDIDGLMPDDEWFKAHGVEHFGHKADAILQIVREGRKSPAIIQRKDVTIAELAEQYIEEHLEKRTAPLTAASAKRRINMNIVPAIGEISAPELLPGHIEDMLNDMYQSEQDYSPTTVNATYRVLRAMLNWGVRRGKLPANPALQVEEPDVADIDYVVWSFDQAKEALALLEKVDPRLRMFVYCALFFGLREGEICGINIETELHLLDKGFLWKEMALQDAPKQWGGLIAKPVKSKSSRRLIELSPNSVQFLRDMQEVARVRRTVCTGMWRGDRLLPFVDEERGVWKQTGVLPVTRLLFLWEDGRPYRPNYVSRRFREFLEGAGSGLPKLPFHWLRHTFASWLDTLGAKDEHIADNMGHLDKRFTRGTYIHAFQPRLSDYLVEMERRVGL
jgi:integrase